MIKINGIDFESIVDGCGVRVVIFFSGCRHNCVGCHNPATHDFNNGKDFTLELQDRLIDYIRITPFISGVTLSGGDPMYSASDITLFVKRLKERVIDKNVWVYSGFTLKEIIRDKNMAELLAQCDVLVDGKFVASQRDITRPYVGSLNQNIIDIQQSLLSGSTILFQSKEVC